MRTTQQLSITLPHRMAKLVRRKVASGQYASESEVLREGLRVLTERDKALETWLREKAVPAAKAMERDPSRGLTAAQGRATLKKRFKNG